MRFGVVVLPARRWAEARAHCRQALSIVTRVLGTRHPSIDGHLDEYFAILRRADQVSQRP